VFQIETKKIPLLQHDESFDSFDSKIEFPETHVAKFALGITGKKK